MSATRNPPELGSCPFCRARIATTDVILEYEVDGQPAVYAECPTCLDVVNPE